jgi:hypothetical protein
MNQLNSQNKKKYKSLKKKYSNLVEAIEYSEHSNNPVEAMNAAPYLLESTYFDVSPRFFGNYVIINEHFLSGKIFLTTEDFFKKVSSEFDLLEYSELLLNFYKNSGNSEIWKKLDSDCSYSCQQHNELWHDLSSNKKYIISKSHWQGEHLTGEDFEEVDLDTVEL